MDIPVYRRFWWHVFLEKFKQHFVDALEGTRDLCFLGEVLCIGSCPNPSDWLVGRPDRVLDSTKLTYVKFMLSIQRLYEDKKQSIHYLSVAIKPKPVLSFDKSLVDCIKTGCQLVSFVLVLGLHLIWLVCASVFFGSLG